MLRMIDYNGEYETAILSLVRGSNKEPVERSISRESLIILMDKMKNNSLKVVNKDDLEIFKELYRLGGVKWFDEQINLMEKI
jgi:hypothetical protein